MPIRDDEKFCKCFLADTEEEARSLLKKFNNTLKLLSSKVSALTGLDPEDLYQEGVIGLARAKRDFDEERSDNFRTFAIYKIKDAMREFSTTQSVSIRSPQYTKDAVRLAYSLRELLIKAGEYQYNSLADMWDSSAKYTGDTPLEESIRESRESLISLADRSHTSVRQLLERSEIGPSFTPDIVDISSEVTAMEESAEDSIVRSIDISETIKRIREYLSEEDYELLWNRYVKGMTVRELAPMMGISAPHVSDRTQALLKKVRRIEHELRGEKVMLNESNSNIEKAESRDSS